MKNREIYVSDGEYSLCRLTEIDKDEYLKLLRETTSISYESLSQEICNNIMWNLALEGVFCEFSIIDNMGNYCGNIMIKYPKTEHPEIGIDIVEKYRNHGIAPKAIKMLAKRAYCDRQVEYYILRVSSQNQHSKHVIEKLGGVLDNSEDLFFNRLLCALKDRFEGESYEKLRKMVKEELLADEEEVYQYKYYPESFLK